jgi:hypothetical protein
MERLRRMLHRKWMATLRQLKGAAGTASLMESCPRVEGFAMGIQFWRTPVRSLVLLALMLTGCATGGDLSTHDMPAIANRTYLVGAFSGFGQCLEAIFRFLANRGCRLPFL